MGKFTYFPILRYQLKINKLISFILIIFSKYHVNNCRLYGLPLKNILIILQVTGLLTAFRELSLIYDPAYLPLSPIYKSNDLENKHAIGMNLQIENLADCRL